MLIELNAPLVLASGSPRRRHLLERLGLPHTVHPSQASEEVVDVLPPGELVETLARRKARDVAPGFPERLTLGADTVVAVGDKILEKPASREAAAAMLAELSGRTHTVYTGLALVHVESAREIVASEATHVRFARLQQRDIDAYVATDAPLDKAGAYGIQDDAGALFVRGIEGDYYNVVGLPLHRLYQLLCRHFADLLA